jgi:hypothetical protein
MRQHLAFSQDCAAPSLYCAAERRSEDLETLADRSMPANFPAASALHDDADDGRKQ